MRSSLSNSFKHSTWAKTLPIRCRRQKNNTKPSNAKMNQENPSPASPPTAQRVVSIYSDHKHLECKPRLTDGESSSNVKRYTVLCHLPIRTVVVRDCQTSKQNNPGREGPKQQRQSSQRFAQNTFGYFCHDCYCSGCLVTRWQRGQDLRSV